MTDPAVQAPSNNTLANGPVGTAAAAAAQEQSPGTQGVLDLVADLYLFELQLGVLRQQAHKLAADRVSIDTQLQQHYPEQYQQLVDADRAAAAEAPAGAKLLRGQLAQERATAEAEFERLRQQRRPQHASQPLPQHSLQDPMQWLQVAPPNGASTVRPLKRTADLLLLQPVHAGGQSAAALPVPPAAERIDAERDSGKRPRREQPATASPAAKSAPAGGKAHGSAPAQGNPSAQAAKGRPLHKDQVDEGPAAKRARGPDATAPAAAGAVTGKQTASSSVKGRQQQQQQPQKQQKVQKQEKQQPAAAAPAEANTALPAAGSRSAAASVDAPGSHPSPASAANRPPRQHQRQKQAPKVFFEPLRAKALTAAEAVLQAAAEDADSAAVADAQEGRSGQTAAPEGAQLVADASAVRTLVQLLCPAVDALCALQREAAGPLHSLEVEDDTAAPKWQGQPGGTLQEAQLLSLSGLQAAAARVEPPHVRSRLQEAAAAAAAARSGHTGRGLMGWFWAAHNLLQEEMQSPVVQLQGRQQLSPGLLLIQQVRSRAYFAELLAVTYQLLVAGQPSPPGSSAHPGVNNSSSKQAAATGHAAPSSSAQPPAQPQAPNASAPGKVVDGSKPQQQQRQQQQQRHQEQRASAVCLVIEDRQPVQQRQQADRAAAAGPKAAAAGASDASNAAASGRLAEPQPAAAGSTQSSLITISFEFQPLSAQAKAAAAATLNMAVAAADAAAMRRQQPSSSQCLLADAASARQLVQQLCPSVSALLAMTPQQVAASLQNLPVQAGEPAKWPRRSEAPTSEAQLLCCSGLKAAVAELRPSKLSGLMHCAAIAAAGKPAEGVPGQGLRSWFIAGLAHLQHSMTEPVVTIPTSGKLPCGVRLKQHIEGRVALAELLLMAYQLMMRGHVQQPPPWWPAAAEAAPAAAAAADADGAVDAVVTVATLQQRVQHISLVYPHLTEEEKRTAQAALSAWAGEADRTPGSQGPCLANRRVGTAAACRQVLLLLCPAAAGLLELTPSTAGQLQDLPVERDDPPRWMYAPGAAVQERQLLSWSGLVAACGPLACCPALQGTLQRAATDAAPSSSGQPGNGLLGWFSTAHYQLLEELQTDVIQQAGSRATASGHFREVVGARVHLAQVLLSVYSLLKHGQLPAAPPAGLAATAGAPAGGLPGHVGEQSAAAGAATAGPVLQLQHGTIPLWPLSAAAKAAADEALKATAAKARPDPTQRNQGGGEACLVSTNNMRKLVRMQQPAVDLLLVIKPHNNLFMRNIQLAPTGTKQYSYEQFVDNVPLEESMLVSVPGLESAMSPVRPNRLKRALLEAVAEAGPQPGNQPGTGLLGFFFSAHSLFAQEYSAPGFAGHGIPHVERVQQLVLSRVYLAELLIMVYNMLRRSPGPEHNLPAAVVPPAAAAAALGAPVPGAAGFGSAALGGAATSGAAAAATGVAAAAGDATRAISLVLPAFGEDADSGDDMEIESPVQPAGPRPAAAVSGPGSQQQQPPPPQPQQQQQQAQRRDFGQFDLLVHHQGITPGARRTAERALADAAASAIAAAHKRKRAQNKPVHVADAGIMKKLVAQFCPAAPAVQALKPAVGAQLGNYQLNVEDAFSWVGASAAGLQEEQLKSLGGLRAAVSPIMPHHVVDRLRQAATNAAPDAGGFPGTGLQGWFWASHKLFLSEMKAPLQMPQGGNCTVGEWLRQVVLARSYWAELLVLVFNMLQRGTVSQQQLEAARQAALAAGAFPVPPEPAPAAPRAAAAAGLAGGRESGPSGGSSASKRPRRSAAAAAAAGVDGGQDDVEEGEVLQGFGQVGGTRAARPAAAGSGSSGGATGALVGAAPGADREPVQQSPQQQGSRPGSGHAPAAAAAAGGVGGGVGAAGREDASARYRGPPTGEIPTTYLCAQAWHAAEHAVGAAAQAALDAVAAGRSLPTMQRTPYINWLIVADMQTARSLVLAYCPEALALTHLSRRTAPLMHHMPINIDTPPKWQFSEKMVLQEVQLLDVSGLRAACTLQRPKPLRKKLDAAATAALNSGKSLRDFFWAAHAVFMQEWNTEAVIQPNKTQVAKWLQECVERRVRLARLLIMAYNLLVRGHVLQQPQQQQPAQQPRQQQRQQQPARQQQARRGAAAAEFGGAAAAGGRASREAQQRRQGQQQQR